jgi:hypothetical protein
MTEGFTIITYCNADYLPALRMFLPGWEASGAERILVFTDQGTPLPPEVESRPIFPAPAKSIEACWDRKIQISRAFHGESPGSAFLLLDTDCFITGNVSGLFREHPLANVIATRMLRRRGEKTKTANAGVVGFRPGDDRPLADFLDAWHDLSEAYRATPTEGSLHGRFHEQTALNDLVQKAFDGGFPGFRAGIASERIYNCESDDPKSLPGLVEVHRPLVIHFKGKSWADRGLVDRTVAGARKPPLVAPSRR